MRMIFHLDHGGLHVSDLLVQVSAAMLSGREGRLQRRLGIYDTNDGLHMTMPSVSELPLVYGS